MREGARGAILQLEGQGVVEIHPHRGAFVCSFDATVLREIAEVRALLESSIARHIGDNHSELTDALVVLANCVEGMRLAARVGDADRAVAAHFDFYAGLVRYGPNRVVAKLLGELREQTRMFISIGHHRFMHSNLSELVEQHQALLQALASGDGDLCEKSYRDHILLLRRVDSSAAAALDDEKR